MDNNAANSNYELKRYHLNNKDLFLMIILLLKYFSNDQKTWIWTSLNIVLMRLLSIP